MKSERLPIADAPGCGECSRRTLLRGLGLAAVGAMILDTGCQQGSSLSNASSSSCGASHCVDLGDSANKELATVGGAMLLDSASDTIMVIRASDTQVIALSAICTHAGCSMDYNASQQLLDCACHGSQFSTDGKVVRGPANRAVHVYAATLANNIITVSG
jgi:cytochrome b6-f complex iron-sulfur subunit